MVTRCVCSNRTFAELKLTAEKYGVTTLEQLQAKIEFGVTCKLCHPYVTKMLKTGETEFGVMGVDLSEP
jgi:hypothetical protein